MNLNKTIWKVSKDWEPEDPKNKDQTVGFIGKKVFHVYEDYTGVEIGKYSLLKNGNIRIKTTIGFVTIFEGKFNEKTFDTKATTTLNKQKFNRGNAVFTKIGKIDAERQNKTESKTAK